MDQTKADKLALNLVRLLSDLSGMHAELIMHMRSKLDAVRRADSDTIQSITARELLLAGRIKEREGLRRQMVRLIEGNLELTVTGTTRLTELAEHLAEPRRSQLLVAAAGLRERLEELQRLQATNRLVTEGMLKHLEAVLAVMTAAGQSSEVYSPTGRRELARAANVFEAVG